MDTSSGVPSVDILAVLDPANSTHHNMTAQNAPIVNDAVAGQPAGPLPERTSPSVTIGVPVYNGESTLRPALDSLLAQTFGDFELIISDNASVDGTERICREYAVKDGRIRYMRQSTNIGVGANFRFVLDEARCKYFMWAASDDVWSLDFVALNCGFLEDHPDYVCSISPVRFEGRDFDEKQMGDRSLDDERFDLRLRKFFGLWHANGAFYSLMRTQVIKKTEWVDAKFLGADWAIILYLARQGKLKRLEKGWLQLGIKGASNSGGFLRRYRTSPLDFVAPFWKMTLAALGLSVGAPWRSRLAIFWACILMNLWAHKVQIHEKLYRAYKSISP